MQGFLKIFKLSSKIILLKMLICFTTYANENFERDLEVEYLPRGLSFDCSNIGFRTIESYLCGKSYITHTPFNQYQDNFFTSYYKLIMQYTPKEKKQEVRKIAREAMKKRNDLLPRISQRYREDGQASYEASMGGEPYPSAPDNAQLFNQCMVELVYFEGVINLTKYILQNNERLFRDIFPQNTSKYKTIFTDLAKLKVLEENEFYEYDELWGSILDSLYQDRLIDKTGKLIIKVESSQESKPSFNCTKATTKVEKMICSDSSGELQNLDRLYSKLYFSILNSIPKNTKQGQETRKQMQNFAKAFIDYRDNMRCFFLAINDDEKEVEEVLSITNDYGVSIYENLDKVRYGLKPRHYNLCIERIYKMGILLLSANVIQDTSSLIENKDDYTCKENLILDIFSIKGLAEYRLYNKFFPKGYEKSIIDISETLQHTSSEGRYSSRGWCYSEDDGFICSNGGCEYDIDRMQKNVMQPLDKFIQNIDARKPNAN